jgi:hypothetical protein
MKAPIWGRFRRPIETDVQVAMHNYTVQYILEYFRLGSDYDSYRTPAGKKLDK